MNENLLKDITTPQYVSVSDLPPTEDAESDKIYVVVQEWMLLHGEMIRIS